MFLRILEALCTAYGWTLEFDYGTDGTDASCAIFNAMICADDAANDANEKALFDPPF